MPITKSAKKSLKVSRTKKDQNYAMKVRLSKALKQVNEKNINETVSVIDKAAKIGIIHKNKAAHLKSALSKKFSTVKSSKAVSAKPVSKKAVSDKATKKTETKAKAKAPAEKTVAKKVSKK